jgi:phage terminase large subunit GpA-like protein
VTIASIISTAAEAIKPPEQITVSEWAQRHRHLDESSAEPGPWRNERTPYAVWPMDLLTEGSRCQRLTLMWASQLGKSNVGVNWIGYLIDCAPTVFMYLLPNETSYKKLVNGPIKSLENPLHHPRIAAKIKALGKDATLNQSQRDFLGGRGYYATAGSPSSVAQSSICKIILDEPDRMEDLKGEGDPLALAKNRQTSYGDRAQTLIPCTPTDENSRIWAEYLASDQHRYWVPCPSCGQFLWLDFWRLEWPKDRPITDDNVILPCPHCHHSIRNHDKEAMMPSGRWLPWIEDEQKRRATLEEISTQTGEVFEGWLPHYDTLSHTTWIQAASPNGGGAIGTHLSAMYCPHKWVTWSELAREFKAAHQSADPEKLRVFFNTRLAEPWTGMPGEEVDADSIISLCAPYTRPVPDPVAALIATIDTQDDRLECQITGLAEHMEMYYIDYAIFYGNPGDVEDGCYDALRGYLRKTFDGMRIRVALWDSGGHNRNQVVNAVERWQREGIPVMAIRGSSDKDAAVWPLRKTKSRDKQGRSYPVTIGIHSCRESLWYRLHLKPGERGRLHFPDQWSDDVERVEYFSQLTAERRVARKQRGRTVYTFEKVSASRRNEAFDLWCYAIAGAYYLTAIRHLDLTADLRRREEAQQPTATAPKPKRSSDFIPKRKSWL